MLPKTVLEFEVVPSFIGGNNSSAVMQLLKNKPRIEFEFLCTKHLKMFYTTHILPVRSIG